MKKHADNLTPSHFGEANDSKINRKQRHRKHCETRDDSGVYQSSRARWKHTHTRHRPSRHLQGSYFLRLQAVRVISKFCMIDECQQLFVKRLESPYLLSGVPKVIQKKKKEKCPLCWTIPAPTFPTREQLPNHASPTATSLWFACHGSSLISPCLYLCLYNRRGRSGNHEI